MKDKEEEKKWINGKKEKDLKNERMKNERQKEI
jgi:hypothetical protein